MLPFHCLSLDQSNNSNNIVVHVQLRGGHKLLQLSTLKLYLTLLQWLEDFVKLLKNLTDYGHMQIRLSV